MFIIAGAEVDGRRLLLCRVGTHAVLCLELSSITDIGTKTTLVRISSAAHNMWGGAKRKQENPPNNPQAGENPRLGGRHTWR
jgi:hypothetical protein